MKRSVFFHAAILASLSFSSTLGSAATLQLKVSNQVSNTCLSFFIDGTRQVASLQYGQSAIVPLALNQGSKYNLGYRELKCGTTAILWQHLQCKTLIPNKSTGTVYVTNATQTACPVIQ